MRKLNMLVLLCTALCLQGCATGTGPVEKLSEFTAKANPFHSEPAVEGNARLYLSLVDGMLKEGRQSASLAFLDGYSQSGRELVPDYWLLRGNALLALGRKDEAEGAFSKLQDTPLSAHGWNGKGQVAAAARQWDAAEKDFSLAVKGDPTNPDFLNNLAFAELTLHEPENAATQLQQAYELNPESDRIRTNLIIALTIDGDLKRADLLASSIKDSSRRDKVRALVKSAVAALTEGNPS